MRVHRAIMAMLVSGVLAVPVMAQNTSPSSGGTDPGAANQTQPANPGSQTSTSSGSQSSMPQSDQAASTATTSGKKKKNPDASDANDTNVAQSGQSMKTEARKDRLFMEKAAAGGLMEVDLGNAVKDKAQDQQVKDFASKMVTDHSKANDELKELMSKKGLSAPTDIPAKDKSTADKIKAKSGADLDKSYMSAMVKDHDKDIKEFQNEAKNGNDPEVKAWAQKTLPTLEEHQKLANDIAQKVGAEGNMKHGHEAKKEAKKESKTP